MRRSYQSNGKVSEILSGISQNKAILALVSIFSPLLYKSLLEYCALYLRTRFDNSSNIFSLGDVLPSFAAILCLSFCIFTCRRNRISMFGSLYTVDNYGTGSIWI